MGYDVRMRRARACCALAASLAIGGCSLLTDVGGLSGGAVATGEGGTLGADAEAESSASGDGGVDALVEAAPSADCTGTHFFCTDFDKKSLTEEWDVVTAGKGTLDRDMTASVSMPFSLLVTHPEGNLATAPIVAKTLPASGIGGLRCRFNYRRDMVESTGVLVVLTVDFNTSTTEHLFVEIKDGQDKGRVYLAAIQPDGGTLDDFPIVPTFSTSIGSWAAVDWNLDLRALRSTLKSNGKLIDEGAVPAFDVARVVSIKLTLGLGNFIAPQGPWQVRYDDFVCDTLP